MSESAQSTSQSKGDDCAESKDEEAKRDLEGGPLQLRYEDHKVHDDFQSKSGPGAKLEVDFQATVADEGPRPPLPPRPRNPELLHPGGTPQGQLRSRPKLQSTATTALSCTDVHTQSFHDGSRDQISASTESTKPGRTLRGAGSLRRFKGWTSGEVDDSASVRSFAPTIEAGGDVESLLGEILGDHEETPSWKSLNARAEEPDPSDPITFGQDAGLKDFEQEFDELDEVDAQRTNEGLEQSLQIYC